jgi:hypothetical protein
MQSMYDSIMLPTNQKTRRILIPALVILCTYVISYGLYLLWFLRQDPEILTFIFCASTPLLAPFCNPRGSRLAWFVPLAWAEMLAIFLAAATGQILGYDLNAAGTLAAIVLWSLLLVLLILTPVSFYASAFVLHKKATSFASLTNVICLVLNLLIFIPLLGLAIMVFTYWLAGGWG